jgi:hypothetical protein
MVNRVNSHAGHVWRGGGKIEGALPPLRSFPLPFLRKGGQGDRFTNSHILVSRIPELIL